MRLSNKNKAPVYNFVNTLLLMFLLGGIMAFLLEEYKFNILGIESYLFIIVPVLCIIIFYLNGRQIFEYDSDGEAVHFRNRSIIPLIIKPLSDEFPKYKLIKYEIISVLFMKRLYIYISSKNNGTAMLKYEISYLTKKETNDLKFSLNKVVNKNETEKRNP